MEKSSVQNQNSYSEYLEHHGVKGQRWGIRRTPEQLGYKKSSRQQSDSRFSKFLKRKISSKDLTANRKNKAAKKLEKLDKKDKKKKEVDEKKAAKKAQKDIIRREKILSDPTLLYKHRKEFSKEEIDKAMKSIKMEQELRQLSMNQLSTGQTYLETAVKYAETGIKAYNKAANIYNAFNKSGSDMPIIGGGKKKKKKDDDD